jgi:hypothetical protein
MDHTHHHPPASTEPAAAGASCCSTKRKRFDWLLWGSLSIIVVAYVYYVFVPMAAHGTDPISVFSMSIAELLQKIWWGIALGILAVGVLSGIPRELVISLFGKPGTFSGILRATLGGMFLDLCSHGILLVGMQLYKRGVSLGQLMAFLIASPWNSLSLTLVLWSLVGLQWTLVVLFGSLVIAIISGLVFDRLEKRGVLPANPNTVTLPDAYTFRSGLSVYVRSLKFSVAGAVGIVRAGLADSGMILRWIFFGLVLASGIRAFVPEDFFAMLFAPTVTGLAATLVFATILEVCSEGSTPVAADFLLRARAPGNMFAFLMGGVSTDYTEILSLKETTKSWKIAFFLPLVTLPQVILVALLLNSVS